MQNPSQPNIVYILADDMGYGDLSCLNSESKIRTENLDKLAAEGMVFRDAHASSAVCTPSRYSILTGRYNWRSRLKSGVTMGYDKSLLEPGRITVASMLRRQGYHTGCIGKWHLGWSWAANGPDEEDVDFSLPITDGPCDRGFDYFFGISASLDMAPYVYVENRLATAVPDRMAAPGQAKAFWREGPIAPDFKHAEVLPVLTAKAVDFIERNAAAKAPFFLYFPLPAPHTPILPAAEFRGRSGTNEYGDFCLHVDHVAGEIMKTLDRNGIAEDTILIFTTDNGCSPTADFAELAAVGHYPSYHFRGHKADIYEGGHRVPLLLRWPRRTSADRVCDETVCLVDLMATCADLLQISIPDDAAEDSISNLPLWTGVPYKSPLREATVHSSIDGSLSIRQGRWKLEMCPGSGGWSYPKPSEEASAAPPVQLYDLEADVSERRNICKEQPQVVSELTDLLTRYIINGRSTPGAPRMNHGGFHWDQLWWLPL